MDKPKAITSLQLAMSIGTSIVGVGILAFPRLTVELANTGAPFTTMIAVVIAILGGWVLVYLGNQYPQQTIFEYADVLVGKWVGGAILFLLGIYFLELGALGIREFGEVVVTSVLPETPIPATILVILLLVVHAARNDIAKFTRILTLYMPLVYAPALGIVILSLKNARMANIMPVLAVFHGQKAGQVILSVGIVTALYQNLMIIGLMVPFMYQPKRAWRSAALGTAVAGGLYIVLSYSTLGVFGVEEIKNLLWPTLELAKTAALPAAFIERLDPIFLSVWVTAVFCAIYAAYYIGIQALSHVLRLKDQRVLAIAALPIVLDLSRLPPNISELYSIIQVVGLSGLPLTFGYPLVLLIVHRLKIRNGNKQRVRVV